MLPILLLYILTVCILFVAAFMLNANWMIYLLYRYRFIVLGIGAFLFIFAAGEVNNLRRR
jgi:hypothetical protein